MTIVAPEFNKPGFHCPHPDCATYAKQRWSPVLSIIEGHQNTVSHMALAFCDHCGRYSVWVQQKMVFPFTRTAPAPHPDMPDKVREDYEEARAVFGDSPRSSSALLRLAIQKTCIELGLPGKNLNEDIGELVKGGLLIQVQQSLDIVRVVGNNQVHPGVLDVRDDATLAMTLFDLTNIIIEDQISRPKKISAVYAMLPEGARKKIEERDAKAKAQP
jgi:hypothetical protein